MKTKLALSTLALALTSTMMINAVTEIDLPTGFEVSSSAGLSSNYIYRGLSLSGEQRSAFHKIDVKHDSGVFANLDVNSLGTTPLLSAIYTVGYASEISGISYSAGVRYHDVIGAGTDNLLFNGDPEISVTAGYTLESIGDLSLHLNLALEEDNSSYYAVGYTESLTPVGVSATVGMIEDTGNHIDVSADVLSVAGYTVGAQVTILMPEDDYKTANSLEDSEMTYNITLTKAF